MSTPGSTLPYDHDAYTIHAGRRVLSVKVRLTVKGADRGLIAFKQHVKELTAGWRVNPVLP